MVKYLILFILITKISFGQNSYLKININGKFRESSNKVYLENVGYGIIDSAFYSNIFVLRLHNNPYSCYRLSYGYNKTKIFFNEGNHNVDINIDLDNYLGDEPHVVEGEYNKIYQNFKDTLFKLHLLKSQAPDRVQKNVSDDLVFKHFKDIIINYPFLGMMAFYDSRELLRYINPCSINIKKYISLFESLDSNLKNHPSYKEILTELDSLNRLTPGGTIHDFSLMNTKKEYIYTFDKRGKFLLVLFSSRGCTYVEEVEKKLIESYNELKSLNFEVLRVSVDFSLFKFDPRLLSNIDGLYNYYPWESVYLFNDKTGNNILRTYNVLTWPRAFLYSPEGILMETNPTIENLFYQLRLNKR